MRGKPPPYQGLQVFRLASQPNDAAERRADNIAARFAPGESLGQWTPTPPSSLLSLARETWFRGEVENLSPATDAGPGKPGVVHDMGEGTYLTDRLDVAEQYAETRSPDPATRRVLSGEVDPHELGRVLDLTEEPDFMNSFNKVKKTLPKVSGEPYRNLFNNFLKKKGLKLEDFDVIIGPEGVRDGKQMCIRDPKAAAKVKGSMLPVKKTGGGGGGQSGGSGGEGEPSQARRRRPVKSGGGTETPSGEIETPAPGGSSRRRGASSLHLPEEAHPMTIRRAGKDIALGLGAGLALGILQSELRGKIARDLAKLPKPKIDKRGAEEFLQDPGAAPGTKLMDLFNKQLKPFRGELSEFHSGLMGELNDELLGLAEKKGTAKGSYQQKLCQP